MPTRITPILIQLTYEAALKSFWRKPTLRKFLRECGVSAGFLATWAAEETKRSFLDRAFEKLQESDKGKAVIYKMAIFLSQQTSFPDLRNWEDSSQKISDAAKAVRELHAYLEKQDEEITSERDREESRNRAHEEKIKIQRANTDRGKLQEKLNQLHISVGTQEGGYAFQDWFFELLAYCEISNKRPYHSNGRQIDGSLTHDGTTYLVELKFTAEQADATDIDSLKAKVESKADNTMGIMVSIAGYSSVAINEASGKRTTVLLLDASHLYLFLTGVMDFEQIISRVRRHASQTGEAYLASARFGE